MRHILLSLSFIYYKIYTESMLRDGLSDGIRVGNHLIKECVWQLKADSSVKGLHLIMGKNLEVAEEYTKNINVRKTKAAAEFTSLSTYVL